MAYDCPFTFYIAAKRKYYLVFGCFAAVMALVGGGLFLFAVLMLDGEVADLVVKIAGGCVVGVAGWLFREAYKHHRPANLLHQVCSRLGVLSEPPDTEDKSTQIEMLTGNGWKICNEP